MAGNTEHDAVKAASKTHKVLFENDNVRVLEVKIQPGEKEPLHAHPYKSITIIQTPSRIKYYDENDNVIQEVDLEGVSWLEPMGLHAAENVGDRVFQGYRIEMKK